MYESYIENRIISTLILFVIGSELQCSLLNKFVHGCNRFDSIFRVDFYEN
jgi:hypothetical protein